MITHLRFHFDGTINDTIVQQALGFCSHIVNVSRTPFHPVDQLALDRHADVLCSFAGWDRERRGDFVDACRNSERLEVSVAQDSPGATIELLFGFFANALAPHPQSVTLFHATDLGWCHVSTGAPDPVHL